MSIFKIQAFFILLVSVCFASPVLNENKSVTRANANSYMEVDTKAFEKNLILTKEIVGKDVKVCAVLKSDAYGAGIINVLPVVIKQKIPCVAITSNEEARVVRNLKYKGEVLRIRTATMGEIKDAMKYNVTEVIGNINQANELNAFLKSKNKSMKIHIKLNTGGMDRNGIDLSTDEGKQNAIALASLSNLKVTGLMTHSPFDEVSKVKAIAEQFQKDTDFIIKGAKLDRSKLTLHMANSYGTVQVPEARFDMVRPGKLIYGYGGGDKNLKIKQIMSLKSIVATINPYPKGSTVSYDATFTLERDSKLANIPVGYYDGYAKSFSNIGHVLIRGHKVPIVGRVTKNTFMVDVTDYPDIMPNDEVVLFGEQCGNEITQEEIEKGTGTILSESLGNWGSANPIFIKDDKIKAQCP